MSEPTTEQQPQVWHECTLAGLLNGEGCDEGIRCMHGALLPYGGTVRTARGEWVLAPNADDPPGPLAGEIRFTTIREAS